MHQKKMAIKFLEKPNTEEEVRESLNPVVARWFKEKFGSFSESQKYTIIPIRNRKNLLLSSPTGSGKTLSAFASVLSYLMSLEERNELENKVYCVYISPLKALSRDIEVNLNKPLEEMSKLSGKESEIRVNVRTGDTSVKDKQKMLRKAPHILVTTPESLAILLTTKKFIEKMQAVEFVIVDEIHALANKRGVHLSLSLERLDRISQIRPVRIGLSATVAPIEEIAKFLVGYEYENKKFVEKECFIADVQYLKKMDLKVLSPLKDLINTTAREMQEGLYSLIDKLIQEHKTTIIFTNTRSATERVINHLKEMFPGRYEEVNETIGAHHSSLSKEHRFSIEQRLREGKLKCVVTSTSLELGIDIGYVDLVVLLGSPKSVARALQRIGRAGHKLHDVSEGRLIVLDRDDLVECSVLLKGGVDKKIDRVFIPTNCLDVLSQQIFGMAIERVWDIGDLYMTIKKSYCYNSLTREDFFSVISYLSGEYAGLENKGVYAKIWYDQNTKQIGKRGRLARMIYMTNIGTIPDESYANVVVAVGERKNEKVGKIDESFLERMKKGDVFVLGGHKYQFLYSRGMNAYVNASVQRPPTIPSWASEMLPLSFDLALDIQHFRYLLEEKFKGKKSKSEIKRFILDYVYCDENSAEAIYNYYYEQFYYSLIPTERRILIETYVDGEKKYYIFHSLYGRRVNDALCRAVAYVASNKTDLEMGISDNGFFIASVQPLQVEKAFKLLAGKPKELKKILEEAVEKTETFKRRFRHCATRALMILRNYKGASKTVGRQQVKSDVLYYAVRKISSDFPILKETKREILEDVMDLKSSEQVLEWVKDGKIRIDKIQTEYPSPFSLNLVLQGYADLMRMENKILFLKRMHEKVMEKIGK
jgi:ATP-dependent Lhr-like helicase